MYDAGGRAVDFDERRIDAIFGEVNQCHLPGVAVGIAIGRTPVYRKGFGLANLELPVVLSPATRMRIFSTTKHFTSLTYLLLCEEGRARIDDTIGQWLPEMHPVMHAITMRQLMGHVSGLRDAHDICWHLGGLGQRMGSGDLLSLYRDIDDTNSTPDTRWSYNNGGYLLLTAVIERILSRSLEEVLQERVFSRIGMHDTVLRRSDFDFVPNSATLHMTDAHGNYDRSYLGTASAGEGGIVSTVDDLLRWLAHMDAPVVGTKTDWELLKSPLVLNNGTSTRYGLGLLPGRYRGVDTIGHPGGGLGGNAQMIKVPSVGLDIVVLSNRHDVSAIEFGIPSRGFFARHRMISSCSFLRTARGKCSG
jgi:D-aminopeptidase